MVELFLIFFWLLLGAGLYFAPVITIVAFCLLTYISMYFDLNQPMMFQTKTNDKGEKVETRIYSKFEFSSLFYIPLSTFILLTSLTFLVFLKYYKKIFNTKGLE